VGGGGGGGSPDTAILRNMGQALGMLGGAPAFGRCVDGARELVVGGDGGGTSAESAGANCLYFILFYFWVG